MDTRTNFLSGIFPESLDDFTNSGINIEIRHDVIFKGKDCEIMRKGGVYQRLEGASLWLCSNPAEASPTLLYRLLSSFPLLPIRSKFVSSIPKSPFLITELLLPEGPTMYGPLHSQKGRAVPQREY